MIESRVLKVKGGTVQAIQFPCLLLHEHSGMVILATAYTEGFLVHKVDKDVKWYGESHHDNHGWTFSSHNMGGWVVLPEGTAVVLINGGKL